MANADKKFLIKLGKKVRIERQKKEFSQDELAERSGISKQTISTIERGLSSPSALRIAKIAIALGIEPYKMFIFDE